MRPPLLLYLLSLLLLAGVAHAQLEGLTGGGEIVPPPASSTVLDTSEFTAASRNLTATMDRMTAAIGTLGRIMNASIPALTTTMNSTLVELRHTLDQAIGTRLVGSIRGMTGALDTQVGRMTGGLNTTSASIDGLTGTIAGLEGTMDAEVGGLTARLGALPADMEGVVEGAVRDVEGVLDTLDASGLMSRVEGQVTDVRRVLDDQVLPEVDQTQALVADTVGQVRDVVRDTVRMAYTGMAVGFALVGAVVLSFLVMVFVCLARGFRHAGQVPSAAAPAWAKGSRYQPLGQMI